MVAFWQPSFFIGRTRTDGSNRRSSRVQWELAHIAEAPGGKAAAGGLVLPPHYTGQVARFVLYFFYGGFVIA